MNRRHLRTIVLPALFGLAAPFLWANALGWLALHYSDLYLWIWSTFGVKGAVVFYTLTVIEIIFFSVLLGVALRSLSGPALWLPAIAFSAAFLVILFAEPIWTGESYSSTHLAVTVAALLVGTALVHTLLVHLRPT
jgi:hypothetical protein